jgi:hypothetical protein
MKQSRRISPRVPYDEAVCLSRADGRGRLYTRSIDLSVTGLQVVCSESLAVGTEVLCTLLLPGGPRKVPGRIVRVTALPRGVGLAVAFGALPPGAAAAIHHLVEARARDVQPAKLRVEGMDRTLRCEGRVDEGTVRLTAALPFLRLDGGVDVIMGQGQGQGGEGHVATGRITKIALDPATSDGVPRLSLEVALAGGAGRANETGIPVPLSDGLTPPPTKLPPPYRQSGPTVVVSKTFERDVRLAEERPPRRRVHGTAEIARRPNAGEWGWAPSPAPLARPRAPARDTEKIPLRARRARSWLARALRPSAWSFLLMIVPALVAAAVVLRRLSG